MRRKTSLAFFAALMVFGATTLSAQDATPPVPTHDMAGKDNCAMCHGEGVMGAPKTSESHAEIGADQCSICHSPAG